MTRRRAAWLAWALCALDVVVVAWLVSFGAEGAGRWSSAAGSLFVLAFATTGALVASRRPDNPVGWLLCTSGLAFAVGGVSEEISGYAAREHQPDLLAAQVAAWVGSYVWMLGVGPAATLLLLLFPDGRLPSPRWRPVAWLAGGSLALTVIGLALAPGPIVDTPYTNPLGVPGGETVLEAAVAGGLALLGVSILASCASLVARFRTASREQRQQLKWIAYSLPLVLLWLAASTLVDSTQSGETAVEVANTLAATGLTVLPVAIGIAMLRHQLYDIDVVINRTVVYGTLTVTLALAYLGSVLLLRLVLIPVTGDSDLAVAASTLGVAALFRPARARIQGGVDRRFYRRRYNASQTLASFSARLRREVELESVRADLHSVVRETVQPVHVSLWLREAR